jgi:hypothetical protein
MQMIQGIALVFLADPGAAPVHHCSMTSNGAAGPASAARPLLAPSGGMSSGGGAAAGSAGGAPPVRLRRSASRRALRVVEAAVLVRVRICSTIRQERARGRCFERLLWELDQAGVTKVVFESRTPHQDRTDRRRVDGLRGRGVITGELRAEWRRGAEEPLLWAPDIVLGALGDARVAGTELDARVAASIQEIVISL